MASIPPMGGDGGSISSEEPGQVPTTARPAARAADAPGPPNASDDDFPATLAQHGIELPGGQIEQLARFRRLLWQWNAKLNLTRHTDDQKFIGRDVRDSLAFAQVLGPKEKVLDVGTGGGVPGVILAILRPDLNVWLCDSVGKKAEAVADIVAQLGLNVPVIHGRAQDLLGPSVYNSLVVRAVGRLKDILQWFRPHWEHFDRLLALKGPAWVEERGEARHRGLLNDLALRKLVSYPLPGTQSESVLLQICPKDRMVDDKTCRLTPLG